MTDAIFSILYNEAGTQYTTEKSTRTERRYDMSKTNTPFRYDYVGSFLRPERLKKARADYENKLITAEELKQVEDENTVAKQTIPAPAQFLEQMIMPFALENTRKYYENTEDLVEDIAKGYRKVIADLYDAGCRNIQLDDCSWGMLVDPRACDLFGTDKAGLDKIAEQLLYINNLATQGAPEDLVINTHVCRGNFHSTYASSGAYDSVARTLFARENVFAYYLEYDDERSGGFEPLREVSGDKKVVLGLITTKTPELEDKDAVIARIHEAAKYIPLDRLYLSPQCGFASCEIGNKLTEEQQWAKLRLVREIAQEVWK